MRHQHTTPFEMCEIKLHVRVPMDTWRQWIRHRTASVNEYSTRYSVAIDSAARTDSREWRRQSQTNKQGSDTQISETVGSALSQREVELHRNSREVYEERLSAGVAREQARKDLPLSTYTEAFGRLTYTTYFISSSCAWRQRRNTKFAATLMLSVMRLCSVGVQLPGVPSKTTG